MADTTGTGISELFQNKMFLQFLSGAGASIAGPDSFAAGVNQPVQQNIASQNFAGLLKKMLAGGGKMTLDKDTFSLKGDSKLLQGPGNNEAGTSLGDMTEPLSIAPTGGGVAGGSQDFLGDILNPSSSPLGDISAADLAGLTPQMISNALELRQAQEQIEDKRVSDVARTLTESRRTDILERQASTAERKADIAAFSALTKDERTSARKNYDFAKTKEGGSFKGTFVDYNEGLVRERRLYDEAVASGMDSKDNPFHKWLLDLRKAGATQISVGERLDIKAKKYFTDPKGLVADIGKHINSEDVQNQMFALGGDEKAQGRKRAELTAGFIESKITGAGGVVTSVNMDGRTRIWTVEWQDGSTSEVKHGF